MREGSTFDYFVTDHQGSVVGVIRNLYPRVDFTSGADAAGVLISETRYMPSRTLRPRAVAARGVGQVRTSVGIITETLEGTEGRQTTATPSNKR